MELGISDFTFGNQHEMPLTSMRCRLKALSPLFASELAEGVDFRSKSHAGLDPTKRLVIAPLEGVRMQEKQ